VNFVAVVHPLIPPATDVALEAPPDLELGVLPSPPQIGPRHFLPPKPHVAAAPAQEPVAADKHKEPTIAPEVATEEVVQAKAETEHNLELAEKNMTLTQGRKLNATQEDLANKVRGFADSARDAMRSGDWVKAKILSGKAEVLAEQLVASF